ncbi:MAG: acyltransferase [Solirubrobacteraceae bacterium]
MPDRIDGLHADLNALHERLRSQTRQSHNRFNPFAEDLFDWHERARAWSPNAGNVTVYNSATIIGDVTIGDDTWVGPYCLLDGTGGLVIGHHCVISTGSQLLTHDTVRWALSGGRSDYEYASTRIGDCCFVGTHAIVTRGVTVGEQSLIAAGAVVTRDVHARSIVAGVPARRIGIVVDGADGGVELRYGRSALSPSSGQS